MKARILIFAMALLLAAGCAQPMQKPQAAAPEAAQSARPDTAQSAPSEAPAAKKSNPLPPSPQKSQPPRQKPAEAPKAATLTGEQAKARALAHAGLDEKDVVFVRTHLDRDDGRAVYDVEFYRQNGNLIDEYDYEIDAATGDILEVDRDAEYYAAPAQGSAGTENNSITADEAKQLALAQVPGASLSDIREFEADYDDGRLEYEGKIIFNKMEYEFEIDGYSGAIRSWDVESVFD